MKINEIFHSLQGEGIHSGIPAVFVRLAGCNLRCPFCDTRHEASTEMTEAEIVAEVQRYCAPLVVFTGGEPALQLTPSLVAAVKSAGFTACIETNGTLPLPTGLDWVTLSPKDLFLGPQAAPVIAVADELKLLFDGEHEPCTYPHIAVRHRVLQPCDTGDSTRNAALMRQAAHYCISHPEWRLSLQIHKILDIR